MTAPIAGVCHLPARDAFLRAVENGKQTVTIRGIRWPGHGLSLLRDELSERRDTLRRRAEQRAALGLDGTDEAAEQELIELAWREDRLRKAESDLDDAEKALAAKNARQAALQRVAVADKRTPPLVIHELLVTLRQRLKLDETAPANDVLRALHDTSPIP